MRFIHLEARISKVPHTARHYTTPPYTRLSLFFTNNTCRPHHARQKFFLVFFPPLSGSSLLRLLFQSHIRALHITTILYSVVQTWYQKNKKRQKKKKKKGVESIIISPAGIHRPHQPGVGCPGAVRLACPAVLCPLPMVMSLLDIALPPPASILVRGTSSDAR